MWKNFDPPVPFLDWYSSGTRENRENNARQELKELAKKDPRFNDPMTAAKFIAERSMHD